jgi:GntR family transcriptional regulator
MNSEMVFPLYQKLAEDIKRQIADGILKENEKRPPELELSKEYSVSRVTVRKAMEILADGGYVKKHQGIGTFVAARKLNRIHDKGMGFTDLCETEGKTPSAELISAEWITATVPMAQHLGIEEGERVLKISRIRRIDGVPVMLEVNYFSSQYSYLMEQDLTKSLYATLRAHGDMPNHAVKVVEIGYVTPEEAEYLNMSAGGVTLIMKETVTNDSQEVIHYCKQVVNPERYKLTIRF